MKKILFPLSLVLIAVSAWFVYPKYQLAYDEERFIETDEVRLRVDGVKKIVHEALSNGDIATTSFANTDPAGTQANFKAFFESINDPRIFRLKVWDLDYRVVWANTPAIIGQRFPDNHEMHEIYEEGETEIEGVLGPSHEHAGEVREGASELGYADFLEVYILAGDSSSMFGVMEFYVGAKDLAEQNRVAFYRSLLMATLLSFVVLGAAMFVLRRRNTQE